MYSRHAEHTAPINATAERIFTQLDDQTRLTEQMSTPLMETGVGKDGNGAPRAGWTLGRVAHRPSWPSIRVSTEPRRGRSHVPAAADKDMGDRWRAPRRLIIGPYRMGVILTSRGTSVGPRVARLRAAVNGDLVAARSTRWAIVCEVVYNAHGSRRPALLRYVSSV